MQTFFTDEKIKYTGKQLAPHMIYKKFGLKGNAVISFIGECDVHIEHMVDIEDVINNEPIYSKNMLSFIEESFDSSLIETVYKQRMLVNITKELIEERYPDVKIRRSGDDLFVNDKKLSVSIATKSVTSTLIHFGLNIDAENAPVNASDLSKDVGVTDIKKFALEIMKRYKEETDDIFLASTKVRGVI